MLQTVRDESNIMWAKDSTEGISFGAFHLNTSPSVSALIVPSKTLTFLGFSISVLSLSTVVLSLTTYLKDKYYSKAVGGSVQINITDPKSGRMFVQEVKNDTPNTFLNDSNTHVCSRNLLLE